MAVPRRTGLSPARWQTQGRTANFADSMRPFEGSNPPNPYWREWPGRTLACPWLTVVRVGLRPKATLANNRIYIPPDSRCEADVRGRVGSFRGGAQAATKCAADGFCSDSTTAKRARKWSTSHDRTPVGGCHPTQRGEWVETGLSSERALWTWPGTHTEPAAALKWFRVGRLWGIVRRWPELDSNPFTETLAADPSADNKEQKSTSICFDLLALLPSLLSISSDKL